VRNNADKTIQPYRIRDQCSCRLWCRASKPDYHISLLRRSYPDSGQCPNWRMVHGNFDSEELRNKKIFYKEDGVKIEIIDYHDSMEKELLSFLSKNSPDHPELGQGDILRWQKCFRFVAIENNKIVGYMAQIPHKYYYKGTDNNYENFGWGVTLVLEMHAGNEIRKRAGRALLTKCENNPPWQYTAIGVVPEIEEPYKRRGHIIRKDCCSMFARPIHYDKFLKYIDKPLYYKYPLVYLNWYNSPSYNKLQRESWRIHKIYQFDSLLDDCWGSSLQSKKELYGERNAEFLNYKISQPNKDYHCYIHDCSGYIIFRKASHKTKDLMIVRICDLVGTYEAKVVLLLKAIKYAYEIEADAVVGISSNSETHIYYNAGMYLHRPYPICLPPHIDKVEVHITMFDSDLDNLW